MLTLYRQFVNQPEVNAQDNRMTPNTFEGRLTILEDSAGWDWLSPLWLRVRYAMVEKEESGNSTDQRDDFRIIFNYELQFTGSEL